MGINAKFVTPLKWAALIVGGLAKFMSGTIFVFNVYQNAFKYTYNYTQTEAEVMSSMLNVGLGIGFIPGMIFDSYGPTVTSIIGLVVSATAYFLIWSSTKMTEFYHTRSWLIAIYFLLGGNGSLFTYMAALNTNVVNFSDEYRGTVIGMLNACFSGGPTIFAIVYYAFFVDGDPSCDENHDFAGYMLFTGISFTVVNALCVAFLHIYPKDAYSNEKTRIPVSSYASTNQLQIESSSDFETENWAPSSCNEKSHNSINNDLVSSQDNAVHDEAKDSHDFKNTILDIDFHIFLWIFGLATTNSLVYINNLTTTTKSMGWSSHDKYIVLILPIMSLIIGSSVGVFSDRIKRRVPRMYFVLFSVGMLLLSAILVTSAVSSFHALIVATIINGIGNGAIWSSAPTYLSELFGTTGFGRNWGIFLLLAALAGMGFQTMFGVLYDSNIENGQFRNMSSASCDNHTDHGDSLVCYGADCVQGGYATIVGVTAVAFILIVFFIVRKSKNTSYALDTK